MKNNITELYTKIDLLWAGKLPEEEKKAFLQAYQTDEALRKEVHFYLNTQKVLGKVADERKINFDALYQEAKKEQKWRKIAIYITLAALFICSLGYVLMPNNQPCTLDMYNDYATTFQIEEHTMSAEKTQQKPQTDSLAGIDAYKDKDFSLAEKELKAYYESHQSDKKMLLYIGLSLFQQRKNDDALIYFNQYEAEVHTRSYAKVKWYKLACYYQKNEIEKVRSLAKLMIDGNMPEANHAKEVLDCIGD